MPCASCRANLSLVVKGKFGCALQQILQWLYYLKKSTGNWLELLQSKEVNHLELYRPKEVLKEVLNRPYSAQVFYQR
jgi:hypothetical protein